MPRSWKRYPPCRNISLHLQQPFTLLFHTAKNMEANRKRWMRAAYFHRHTTHAPETLDEMFCERYFSFENLRVHKLVDSIRTYIAIENRRPYSFTHHITFIATEYGDQMAISASRLTTVNAPCSQTVPPQYIAGWTVKGSGFLISSCQCA